VFAPVQTPDWQLSLVVHAFPSLQLVPFGAVGVEHVPVTGLHVPATWHVSAATHTTDDEGVHAPPWQESPRVHALPSLHDVPFAAAGLEHVPDAGLHVPATWHASLAEHAIGFPPMHTPAWHVSLCVHALPSLHAVPLEATGFEQTPVLVLHVPATWHASLAVHAIGFPPVHTPAWHVSLCVHALPSLHAVPLEAAGFEQTPVLVLHVPATWHASLAVHVIGFPPVHTPAWHVSLCVHALPSLQAVPSAAAAHGLPDDVTVMPEGSTRLAASRQPFINESPEPTVIVPLGAVMDPGNTRPPPSCTVVPLL